MSVSRWRYEETCDSMPCCGDCDSCEIVWEKDDGLIMDDLLDIGVSPETFVRVSPSDHSVLMSIHDHRYLFDAINKATERDTVEETVQEIIKEVRNDDSDPDPDDI